MPELPEVETVRSQLEKKIKGAQIKDITWDVPKLLLPNPEKVKQTIVGNSFTEFGRRGKLLLMKLSNGATLAAHLKLTGRLLLRKKGDPKDEWQHVVISLDKDRELRFTELRKFGYIKVLENQKELEKVEQEYGPEPLSAGFTPEVLNKILSNKKSAIKKVLLDQKNIAGIGNIYDDESLFAAKIHPERLANTLTPDEIKELHKAIQVILKNAIKYRGTSVDSYRDIYGEKGTFAQLLKVYARQGKPCLNCGTAIKKIVVGGRGTHFCPHCQQKQ